MTRVADSGGLFLNVGTTQTVLPAVQVTTSSVAAATLNESFTTTLMATGGKPGYTWSVASGTLPAGLGLSAGGVLSGTPTTAGISDVTVRATDTLGGFADQALQRRGHEPRASERHVHRRAELGERLVHHDVLRDRRAAAIQLHAWQWHAAEWYRHQRGLHGHGDADRRGIGRRSWSS